MNRIKIDFNSKLALMIVIPLVLLLIIVCVIPVCVYYWKRKFRIEAGAEELNR